MAELVKTCVVCGKIITLKYGRLCCSKKCSLERGHQVSKEYNKNHPEKIKMIVKKWKEQNPEKVLANNRKFKEKNPNYTKDNYKKNREKQLDRHLLNDFNIKREEYNNMLIKQDKKCVICKLPYDQFKKKLAVDHNHKSKEVRGLLCSNCNIGLGHFNDDIILLAEAIKYLLRRGSKHDKK